MDNNSKQMRYLAQKLNNAYKEFNEATDSDLVDSIIYKIASIELEINYYIKQEKRKQNSLLLTA